MRALLAVAIWLASLVPALAQPIVYVANRQSSFVSVVDAFTERTIAAIEVGGTPVALAMSPDGSAAWVTVDTTGAGGPRTVRAIQLASRTLLPAIAGLPQSTGLSQTSFRPDGTRAYVADAAGRTVYAIDTATLQVVASITVATGPLGLTPVSNALGLVVSASARTLSLIDLGANRVTNTNPTGPNPAAIALNPNGSRAYLFYAGSPSGYSDAVQVLDAPNGRIIDSFTAAARGFGSGVSGIAYSPDGTRFYAVNRQTNLLTIIDASFNRVLGTVATGREPAAVVANAANTRVYVANADSSAAAGSVSVVDTATQRVVQTIPAGAAPTNLAITPSGAELFVANGGDASLTNIDLTANQVLATLIAGNQPVDLLLTFTIGPDPVIPQSGWWWNPAEGGRGFAIEISGNNLYMSTNLYAADGTALWYAASGRMTSLSSFEGSLDQFAGGQTLTGPYVSPRFVGSAGSVQLNFSSATIGTMIWPGGTVPLQRFDIVQDGVTLGPNSGLPESGWWWNPVEPGRGYFMEFQRGSLMIATNMYDDRGQALWYSSQGQMTSLSLFQNLLTEYSGGQTLTGSYHPPSQAVVRGPITLQFSSSSAAQLILPGGRQVSLSRFRF